MVLLYGDPQGPSACGDCQGIVARVSADGCQQVAAESSLRERRCYNDGVCSSSLKYEPHAHMLSGPVIQGLFVVICQARCRF